MLFGKKPDAIGPITDFDAVYKASIVLAPAIAIYPFPSCFA
jgi:hypothetical protein